MSILIKGMEMPTSCDKCIYSAWSNFYQIYVCNVVRKNEPVLFDGKQTKSTAVARSARADNCPLVTVPPHGRLIDADALLMRINHEGMEAYMDGVCYGVHPSSEHLDLLGEIIDDAPTIIPASEDKT